MGESLELMGLPSFSSMHGVPIPSLDMSVGQAQQAMAIYEREIARCQRRLEELSKKFDDWPGNRPPDWQSRRSIVAMNAGVKCEICGRKPSYRYLGIPFHVHHKVRVSKGGNHAYSNLQYLCEYCHAKQPGPAHGLLKGGVKKRRKLRKLHSRRSLTVEEIVELPEIDVYELLESWGFDEQAMNDWIMANAPELAYGPPDK